MDPISAFQAAARKFLNFCKLKQISDSHAEFCVEKSLNELQFLWTHLKELYQAAWIFQFNQDKACTAVEKVFDICSPLFYNFKACLLNIFKLKQENLKQNECKFCVFVSELQKSQIYFTLSNINSNGCCINSFFASNLSHPCVSNDKPANNQANRDISCEKILKAKSLNKPVVAIQTPAEPQENLKFRLAKI